MDPRGVRGGRAREPGGTGPTRPEREPAPRLPGSVEPGAPGPSTTLAVQAAIDFAPGSTPSRGRALRSAGLLQLQRSAGNAAIARLLDARRHPATTLVAEISRKATLDEEWTGPPPEADEKDVDTSEYTSDPRAAEALAKIPPKPLPPPPAAPGGPPVPTKPKVAGTVKPSPKPPVGPHGRKGAAGAKAAGMGAPGVIVKKPAPPPPPRYRFKPGMGVAAPGPLETRKPADDPAFAKVATSMQAAVKKARKHPSGKQEADAAQLAARAPANDKDAQAKAGHADTMAEAKPKEFSADDFYAAMKAALEQARPKNLKEAANLDEKAAGMQEAVKGTVNTSKAAATSDVQEKVDQPPDPSKAVPKDEAPMTTTEIEPPGGVQASAAMRAPVPADQVDLRAGPAQVDQEMVDADISEKQLAEAEEPAFDDALKAKKEGEEDADKAPVEMRKAEAAILNRATADAAAAEKGAVDGTRSKIVASLAKVATQKGGTRDKDEQARKAVADNVNRIYEAAKTDVDGILGGLNTKVEKHFEIHEARIRREFTADWNRRLSAYKSRRYSGLRGKWRWVRDKFKGLPEAANKEYEASQKLYEAKMDKLARDLSKMVAADLNAATRRVQQGRHEIATYVGGLKGDLARIGQEAAADVSDKLDDLDSNVGDTFKDLASSLGKKYAESEQAVKAEIEAAKEANKGLIDKAIDAVKGVIDTIRNLKDLLLNLLSKVASAIGDIIKAPVRFLKNFFTAVKEGISRFATNIVKHLKQGLMGWLVGNLGGGALDIPETFDVRGIMQLVLQVLGVTWNTIRAGFVRKIGEPAMDALEKGSDIVQKVMKEGPVALWEMLLEKFSDFEDTVLGKIKEFIEEKVVVAGITFLLSMLNPASAFIKACKMIYDTVVWLMDNGKRILELIHTIIDSIVDVAKGGVGGVPEKIENVLARLLPLAIGFLASLVGVGGVGKKVAEIIDRARKPLVRARDKVIDEITKTTKPIWGRAKRMAEKGKQAYGNARTKVAGVKGKATSAKRKEPTEDAKGNSKRSQEVKAKVRSELLGRHVASDADGKGLLQSVYTKYRQDGLRSLELLPDKDDPSTVTVLVRASTAEAIALQRDPRKIAPIAIKLITLSKATNLFVYYEDKLFKTYRNSRKPGGHAERNFEKDFDRLLRRIRRERAKGKLKTAPGKGVPVTLDINRLPCDHCAPVLIAMLEQAKDDEGRALISLTVNAASNYQEAWNSQADLLSDKMLKAMILKGIKIQPLHVWDMIKRQLQSAGVSELVHGKRVVNLNEMAATFASHAYGVQERLDDINRQIEREKPKPIRVGGE